MVEYHLEHELDDAMLAYACCKTIYQKTGYLQFMQVSICILWYVIPRILYSILGNMSFNGNVTEDNGTKCEIYFGHSNYRTGHRTVSYPNTVITVLGHPRC
jgi:hypothetical protein